MRLLWLPLYILLLTACNRSVPTTDSRAQPKPTEEQLDSIFEAFEGTAYERPQVYVHHPDSFFNSLAHEPQSAYQKEMYTYGLVFMGYSLLEHGNNLESVKYYEKAYNYSRSHQVDVANLNTEVIKPLANLYVRINDTQKSIALLKAALLNTKENNESVGLSNNLANAYLYNSELDSAKSVLFQALKRPGNTLSTALLYNTLASVYEAEQNKRESRYYNRLALEGFEKSRLNGDTLLWYIGALGLKGDLNGDPDLIDQATVLAEKHFPDAQNRFKAKLTLIKGNNLSKQHRHEEALAAYDRTLAYFGPQVGRAYVLDYTYTQALTGKAAIFGLQKQVDSALYYYEWAIENDFRTQQLIVSSRDQLRNNTLNKELIEQLITFAVDNLALSRHQDIIQQLLWCIELSKARLLMNEIYRSEEWNKASPKTKAAIQTIRDLYYKIDISTDREEKRKLSDRVRQVMLEFQLSEKYFEAMRFEPKKSIFLQHLNKPNTDFYSYFIHHDSRISIIHKTGENFYFKQVSTDEPLNRLVAFKRKYFGNTPNCYNHNPKEYYQEAGYLTDQLLPQLDTAQQNIFVSLDGQLYGFPFDALYRTDFLVKRYNFAYLNSFLLFDFLPDKRTTGAGISVLYRAAYTAPLPDLRFVDKEVKNIREHFSIKEISPEKQNDSTIREQFTRPDIIHIAAHTILDTLAAPVIYLNQAISTNQLRFYEMNTPLVFLSACNTGHGRPLPSEGTESIQRVFLSKNVPSVISTFWFANDQTMLDLTASFYKQLNETEDPVSALAESKRIFLRLADPVQQNPWYWANINYTGVGNKIGLKPSSNLFYYILGIVGFAVFAYGYTLTLWFHKTLKHKDKKTDNKTK